MIKVKCFSMRSDSPAIELEPVVNDWIATQSQSFKIISAIQSQGGEMTQKLVLTIFYYE